MKFGKLLQELIDGNPQMSEQPLIRLAEMAGTVQQQHLGAHWHPVGKVAALVC